MRWGVVKDNLKRKHKASNTKKQTVIIIIQIQGLTQSITLVTLPHALIHMLCFPHLTHLALVGTNCSMFYTDILIIWLSCLHYPGSERDPGSVSITLDHYWISVSSLIVPSRESRGSFFITAMSCMELLLIRSREGWFTSFANSS